MSDLAAWLLEQIAWTERQARMLDEDANASGQGPLVRVVLAECEAKRRIVDAHLAKPRRGERIAPYPRDLVAAQTLRLLASVYADRPGYDESWRP